MIVGLIGRVFQAVGRLRGGAAGDDLTRVGGELRRLESAPTQRPATSR
jgi:hypothetical protein